MRVLIQIKVIDYFYFGVLAIPAEKREQKEHAPRRAYQSTDRRQSSTVEAVVALCAEHDPATLTTAQIAARVGLSQGALFKHFPNKNRLWEAVAQWVASQLAEHVLSAADQHSSADRALEAMFLAHARFVAHHPGIPRLMLGELQKPGRGAAKAIVREVLAQYRRRVSDVLEQGVAQGCIAAEVDTQAAAVLFQGAIQGMVLQSMVSGDTASLEQVAPKVFGVYRRCLQGAPDAAEA